VLRVLRGNPSKRPINRDEPKPDALPDESPAELTDPEAIAEWHRTVVPAITTGQITAADRVFAIAHCELWATWRSQLADAAKHPHVVAIGQHKHPMPNKTLQLLAKVDAELGLTPVSRSRVTVGHGHDAEEAELDRILSSG
jgi:phage terminase small subunit